MDLQKAFENFGVALGDLKRAFAEEYGENSNYIQVHIDDGDYVTVHTSMRTGGWFSVHREWVDTEARDA